MGVLLRLATRGSWRAFALLVGVALCSAYLTGTLALAEGLRAGTHAVASRLPPPTFLAYRGDDLTRSTVDPRDLQGLAGAQAKFRLLSLPLYLGGSLPRDVFCAAVDDPSDLTHLGPWLPEAANRAAVGGDLWEEALDRGVDPRHLLLGGFHLNATPYGGHGLVPNDWVLISPALMDRLPGAPARPSFLIVAQPSDADLLASRGYTIVPTATSAAFLTQGVDAAALGLLAIVASTAVSALLLVFGLLSLEVRHRSRDLALVSSLGGSRRLLGALIVGQGVYITLFGMALGIALGITAVHGLVSFAPYLGLPNLLEPRVTPQGLLVTLALVPPAGLVGSLVTAARARPWAAPGVPA